MAALSDITAINGDATPVSYTFTPLGPDAKGVQWFEQTTPTPANGQAAARLSCSIKRAVRNGSRQSLTGIAKVEFGIYLPVMETMASNDAGITPPPTVAYECAARVVYFLPERSTMAERKNLRVLAANLIATNVSVRNIVDQLQPLF